MGEINDDPFGTMQTGEAPRFALSVRQPWAWAIIHAGKDIENRSAAAVNHGMTCKRIAIHASKSMAREEYEDARRFIDDVLYRNAQNGSTPRPDELVRGALIGSVSVVDVVKSSDSLWWMGPRGLVLKDACAWSSPIPCAGALGYFNLGADRHPVGGALETPKPWMRSWPEGTTRLRAEPKPLPLFAEPAQ